MHVQGHITWKWQHAALSRSSSLCSLALPLLSCQMERWQQEASGPACSDVLGVHFFLVTVQPQFHQHLASSPQCSQDWWVTSQPPSPGSPADIQRAHHQPQHSLLRFWSSLGQVEAKE